MEILSPLNQSILQWDKTCQDESVDNFDLALSLNGALDNTEPFMSVDQPTFHTPNFGDEEFEIPPINLQPTTPSSDTNSSDVYGSTQPLSHQDQPIQQQQQQQQQTSNNNNHHQQQQQQQHMMSPPPQMHSPAPCSQQAAVGPVMTAVTTTPSPPSSLMTSYSGGHHLLQQQQQQYCNPGDTYMLQIGPGSMMPPQAVQFQVQQYSLPSGYSTMQQQHQLQHMEPPQQHSVPQHHHMQSLGHHQHHHNVQHHHLQHHQLLPPSPMLALQLSGPPRPRPGSVGGSPPGSNHTSPGLETSEDSDDSGHLSQLLCGIKRPSPEPIERPPSVGKPVKKPKVQKKKKKKDPNEPQKPVSAYALFFRDTQAAIKGQNPSASFGEVSKIVASMWDGLDLDHKNVYKKKTEAAKKEYLKALAAYRASLVSKAANDQSDNIYGGGANNVNTPTSMSSPMTPQSLSPLQKKSPLLTSLMEGIPVSGLQNMTQPQSLIMGQSQMGHHQHMLQQQQQHGHPSATAHQMLHQMLSPGATQQMLHTAPVMMPHRGMQGLAPNPSPSNGYAPNMSPQLAPPQQGVMCASPLQNCPRNDTPQDWERDFCNNDCVVSHCRDVFTTWVAARPPQTTYASVK